MSEMFMSSGKTRPHECRVCKQTLEQKESVGLYVGTIIWHSPQHIAPCGAYCWGAGVPGREYREKRLHGYPDYLCPKCGYEAPKERP